MEFVTDVFAAEGFEWPIVVYRTVIEVVKIITHSGSNNMRAVQKLILIHVEP